MVGIKLIKIKVAASTILEVIIAMILITVVFSIAMMIFSNVTSSSLPTNKLRALAVLRVVMNAAEKGHDIHNDVFNTRGFTIKQTIIPYDSVNDLTEIYLTAVDTNGRKIAEIHKVIENE